LEGLSQLSWRIKNQYLDLQGGDQHLHKCFKKKNDFIHSYDPKSLPVDVADAVERGMEEQLQQLYGAIARLNEIEKAIVMLYLEDRSYEEMVEILGISNGALRVKMNRIKNKLRGLTQTS
jgi:RNA polymerase sigma-70 factor (ECF subfamily)